MAVTVPIPSWKIYGRIAQESAFNTNVATADWNIGGNGGGVYGWRDLPVSVDTVMMQPTVNNIFPAVSAGKRGINQSPPVAGAYSSPGSIPMMYYPELIDPLFQLVMGSSARTPTAGSAALAATAFASVATLDTQPDGTEQLKFVIASSTAASAASIDIIQSAVTVETITIGTSASSVDGDYYSKGAYDGSSNAITFSVSGTVTAGTVAISGIDLNTNVHTFSTTPTAVTAKLEEGGLPKYGTNSGYYNGLVVPSMEITFDRTAADGMVTVTCPVDSRFPAAAAAGTFADDANLYYKARAGWSASFTKGGAAFDKVQSFTMNIMGNAQLFSVSTGDQQPGGAVYQGSEVTMQMAILEEDNTEWAAFTANTVGDYHMVLTSPDYIVDTTYWTTTFEFTKAYIETHESSVNDGLVRSDIGFRTIEDTSDGALKVTNVCRMPI